MQGEELKAIRKAIGMSQGQFAEALGLTGTFIGLMERGVKPIEKRTALAVLYLRDNPGGSSAPGDGITIEKASDLPPMVVIGEPLLPAKIKIPGKREP